MITAAQTQPLSAPWRRAAKAARLHIALDRVASLVVEDQGCPVPRLDARVFAVVTHDDASVWREVIDGLHDLRADLEDRISRAPVPAEVSLDRRRRVA